MTEKFLYSAVLMACTALAGQAAQAAGDLNLICSADVVICELMKGMFEKETGIKVNMVRLSSGETYAKIRAEARNPKTDIWWAGTGDPHLQAASEGADAGIQVADARPVAGLGEEAGRECRIQDGRRLCRCARLGLQHRDLSRQGPQGSRNAGPTCSIHPSRAKSRSPTRIRPALPIRRWRRSCRSWARTRHSTT